MDNKYDDLVKLLRERPRVCQQYEDSVDQLHDQAADAIEELLAKDINAPCSIPAKQHGRLIDADDFIKRMEGLVHRAEAEGYDLGAAWYTAFIRHIELAPTVIEASE